MINYNLICKYNSHEKGFIIFNNNNPIGMLNLMITFNISKEKIEKILNQIKFEYIPYEKLTLDVMVPINSLIFKFFTNYDANLFIEKLEAELLIQILQGKVEELTVSQMIKLL